MSRKAKKANAAGKGSKKAAKKSAKKKKGGPLGFVVRRYAGDDYVRLAAVAVARRGWRSWRKFASKGPEELYTAKLGRQSDLRLRTDRPAKKNARTKVVKQELEAVYRDDLERT